MSTCQHNKIYNMLVVPEYDVCNWIAPSLPCKAYGNTYEYDDGEQTKEDFYLDGDAQTELIFRKTDNGNIEAIAEIDYKKVSQRELPMPAKWIHIGRVAL